MTDPNEPSAHRASNVRDDSGRGADGTGSRAGARPETEEKEEWTAQGGTTPAFLTFRKVAAAIFGVLALALLAFLATGLFLTGEWTASATGVVDAEPAEVFAQIESPAAWAEWSDWGELEGEPVGPGRGAGAGWRWESERYGNGELTVTHLTAPRSLAYRVEIEDGSLVIDGSIELRPVEGGTEVVWRESGDFGSNPLMGYVARTMPTSQSAQLRESIERLNGALRGR